MYNKTKEPTDDAVALANLLICILGGGSLSSHLFYFLQILSKRYLNKESRECDFFFFFEKKGRNRVLAI